MPEEAVAAPIEETPVESTTETTETPTETTSANAETLETTEKPPVSNEVTPQIAIAALKKLKAENPALALAFKSAYFEQQALRKDFPEGVKAIRETMARLNEVGGVEKLPELAERAGELSRIDDLYDRADPEFVKGMIESNPESFAALMPIAIEKWKESNFDAYASTVAKDVIAGLDGSGVRSAIEGLARLAKSNPEISGELQPLIAYYNSIFELSQKPAANAKPAEAPKDAISQERADLERERQSLISEKWGGTRGEIERTAFNAEMSKIMQGKPQPSDTQRAAIGELYHSRMARASQESKHKETVDRYVAAKDFDGYKRYMVGFYRQNLPRALSSAVDAVLGRAKAASAAAPAARPAPAAPQGARPQGFTPSSRPDIKLVDMRQTTNTMYFKEKRAILKDGKRISWT